MGHKLTYKVNSYPMADGSTPCVAIAWSDDGRVLLGTGTEPSYTAARRALDRLVAEKAPDCRLYWFDGEHTFGSMANR